jgi:cyclase
VTPLRTPPPRLERVGEQVYAFVQPPGGWCLNNAGILTGGVLIDTAATETRARLLRAAADAVTERPVHTVVNTHFHGDHTFGNGLVGDGVTVVAHELTRHDMAVTGHGMTRLWPEVAWGRVAPDLPTVTFTDRLTLHQCDPAVELVHVGTAHTTGDVVAWLPDERVLFTGDVAFSGGTPYLLMGSVEGSRRALDRLRALDPRVVVCGHGPVAGPEVLDTVESYLALVHRLAVRGMAAGHDPLRVARDADLDGFGMLRDSERLVANLHRAYAELHGAAPGEPLDVLAVHRDMTEYRGERIVSLA